VENKDTGEEKKFYYCRGDSLGYNLVARTGRQPPSGVRFLHFNVRETGRLSIHGYNHPMVSLRNRAQGVYRGLLGAYGEPHWDPKPPVDELISTILSQNTNDANRDRAFSSLCRRYPDWEDLLESPVEDIVESIRPAGLGPQKGPRIRAVFRKIKAERGRIELDFLRTMPADEVTAWLTDLPGVGPKTAAIVMLFALDLPAFPVDTHVQRVTGRLGLRPERMPAGKTHGHLAGLFEPGQYATAHLNLVRLGREICRARNPDCPRCPLRRMCPNPRRVSRAGRNR
jgi:endonuclease-3